MLISSPLMCVGDVLKCGYPLLCQGNGICKPKYNECIDDCNMHVLSIAARRAIVQKRSDNKRLERTVDKIRKRLPLMGERVKSLSIRLTDKQAKQEGLDTRLATRRREVVTQVERFVFSLKPVPDRYVCYHAEEVAHLGHVPGF